MNDALNTALGNPAGRTLETPTMKSAKQIALENPKLAGRMADFVDANRETLVQAISDALTDDDYRAAEDAFDADPALSHLRQRLMARTARADLDKLTAEIVAFETTYPEAPADAAAPEAPAPVTTAGFGPEHLTLDSFADADLRALKRRIDGELRRRKAGTATTAAAGVATTAAGIAASAQALLF